METVLEVVEEGNDDVEEETAIKKWDDRWRERQLCANQ